MKFSLNVAQKPRAIILASILIFVGVLLTISFSPLFAQGGIGLERNEKRVATLLGSSKEVAQDKVIKSFVITNASNLAACKLYERTGAERPNQDDVLFVYQPEESKSYE